MLNYNEVILWAPNGKIIPHNAYYHNAFFQTHLQKKKKQLITMRYNHPAFRFTDIIINEISHKEKNQTLSSRTCHSDKN